jgi:signal peptidase I
MARRARSRTRRSPGKLATPDLVVRDDRRTRYECRRPAGAAATLSLVSGAARATAALLLAVLAGLVIASLAPQALGLSAHVVVSGSMAPQIDVGDVVLTAPVAASDLRAGQVVLFTDPDQPDRLLLHRLVSFADDGSLVTRGDANPSNDSTNVPVADVQGLARLRVPYVGLPAQWRLEGRFGSIALSAAALAGAAVFVCTGVRRPTEVATSGATRRTRAGHRSSGGGPTPMTGTRPPVVAHVAVPRGGTSTEDRRKRAQTAIQRIAVLPPVPGARPGDRRPAAAGVPGGRVPPAAGHGHDTDGGDVRRQPGR